MYHFLSWKAVIDPRSFNTNDMMIINSCLYDKFDEISLQSCSYTRGLIKQYSEVLWQERINTQFQLNGISVAPLVNTNKLSFPPNTSRRTESIVLSLLYPNNLFNTFLHYYDNQRFPSPICTCGNGQQDSLHVLMYCNHVNQDLRSKMEEIITRHPHHDLQLLSNSKFLISWSRQRDFIGMCTSICESIEDK